MLSSSPEEPPIDNAREIYFSRALQSIYSEICLINYETDISSVVYQAEGIFEPLPRGSLPVEKLLTAMLDRAHPDDRALISSFLDPVRLRALQTENGELSTKDIRKKCADGSYQWVRAIILPMPSTKPQ
jgi:PAS fold.